MRPKSIITDEMQSYLLPTTGNLFADLLASVRFESVGKGRQGVVLVEIDEMGRIPIVRTTTRYQTHAQSFPPLHRQLAQQIQQIASLPLSFNNALVENYTNAYTKMGSHSDQALDLADESFIAIFSCYKYPDLANPPRQLIVESKESEGDRVEIPLTHNSTIVFDLNTNRRFKHKIVLDTATPSPENQWLGITFRRSKTSIQFRDGHPFLADNQPLTLADEDQERAFYRLRQRENNETDFTYPSIAYTISPSDLMLPISSS